MRRLLVLAVFAAALWAVPGALAGGWCGSGESAVDRPDVTTGDQLHALVLVPSDGADNFSADASLLADDVTSMVTWWQGQDPTHVPRYDLATFGTATCLDISFLRLPWTGAVFARAGASLAYSGVIQALQAAGFNDPSKKYLAYFDGPSVERDICGTGNGDFASGPSYAVVWLQGCPGIPTDTVATHELLHALGALPAGAPHACPGDSGHPCDSPTDVLYPSTSGTPLSSLVLDYNHDDYYAHSGNWIDIQDSLWLRRLDVPQVALSVSRAGAGVGVIRSDLPGIDCTVACTTMWDQGTHVTLSAAPTGPARFVGWTGACTGPGNCTLTLEAASSAVAVFGPLRAPLRLSTTGQGRIACSPGCGTTVAAGGLVTLRAVPAKGWKFRAWSGACTGTQAVCRPATDFAVKARATFARIPKQTPAKVAKKR